VAGPENPLWLGLLNVGSAREVKVEAGSESPVGSRFWSEERVVVEPENSVGLGLLNVGSVRLLRGKLENPVGVAVLNVGSVRVGLADTLSLVRVLNVGSVIEKEPMGPGFSDETPLDKGVISAMKDGRRRLA
jgi:hypothetical protein